MHCAKKSQCNKNRKKKILALLLKTSLLILWFGEEKCFIYSERQRTSNHNSPPLSETQVAHGEYRKAVTARHHRRTCYHSSSQSPQRAIVGCGLLFTYYLFSFLPSFFPDVLNQLFPSQLQALK